MISSSFGRPTSVLSWVTAVQAGGTPRSEPQVGIGWCITVGAAPIKVPEQRRLSRSDAVGAGQVGQQHAQVPIMTAQGKVVGPRVATPDALGFAYGTVM